MLEDLLHTTTIIIATLPLQKMGRRSWRDFCHHMELD
jgi:hypothetical protein